jgi:hypothetical protein
VTAAINQLGGQGIIQPAQQGLQALQQKTIDPTTSQIISAGSRTSALTTNITTSVISNGGASSITFLWDGSGGSQVFKIGRDDGTVYGPNPAGSPFAVSGLTNGVTYFFYPYFDESLQAIRFAQVVGVSVGTPAVAFTVQNFKAAQQQMLRGHIPLCSLAGSTGIAIPGGAGTTTVQAGSGAGGGGQLGGNRILQ